MTLSRGQRHMLLATFLFSVMGALVKHLHHIPAHEVVTFRAAVSFALCLWAFRHKGVSPWGRNRRLLLARGALGTAALLLYFHTLQHMPLATAVTVQYLSPIFTILVSGLFLREAASSGQWFWFVLCFLGVGLMKGFDPRVAPSELLLGIAAAVFSAGAYNLVRKLRDSNDPLVVVFYFPLVTLPLVGTYTAFHWVSPTGWDWVWLLAVGFLTQAAQVSLTKAYHLERAANVSHFTYLGSLLALIYGYLFFGEAVPLPSLVGIGLVVGSVLLCTRLSPAEGRG